jgi:cell division protein FtsB
MKHKKHSTYYHILNSKLAIIILFLLLCLFVLAIIKNNIDKKNISQNIEDLDQEIIKLEKQNMEISDLINYFSSQNFIEKEARQKLNLTHPGEKVVIVPEKQNISQNKKTNNTSEKKYIKWWNFFFNHTQTHVN